MNAVRKLLLITARFLLLFVLARYGYLMPDWSIMISVALFVACSDFYTALEIDRRFDAFAEALKRKTDNA